MVGRSPAVAAVVSAAASRSRAAPAVTKSRQGCVLELEGAVWARARASSRRWRGTGVGR